jgi:hypothetical protein
LCEERTSIKNWDKYRKEKLENVPVEERLALIYGWMRDPDKNIPRITFKQFKHLTNLAYDITVIGDVE